MTNPYQPPPELRRLPFLKRLRRGCELATAEFRSGLKRDGFRRRDLIVACLGLIATMIVVLAILVWCVMFALVAIGMA